MSACKQLVQQHAERVHIGRRRHIAALNLFRCGVIGRERMARELCQFRG